MVGIKLKSTKGFDTDALTMTQSKLNGILTRTDAMLEKENPRSPGNVSTEEKFVEGK